MTLDEAIKYHEDMAEVNECAAKMLSDDAFLHMDSEYKNECRDNAIKSAVACKEHRQLVEWLEDYKLLRGEYETCQLNSINDYRREAARCRAAFFKVDSQFHHLGMRLMSVNDELKEAKRLLKAAVENMNDGGCTRSCSTCKYGRNGCKYTEGYEWIHTDEALKLIGGETDEHL